MEDRNILSSTTTYHSWYCPVHILWTPSIICVINPVNFSGSFSIRGRRTSSIGKVLKIEEGTLLCRWNIISRPWFYSTVVRMPQQQSQDNEVLFHGSKHNGQLCMEYCVLKFCMSLWRWEGWINSQSVFECWMAWYQEGDFFYRRVWSK